MASQANLFKMPKVGAHVSAAQSIDLSFDRASAMGAECTQIFISPPQRWDQTSHGDEKIKLFKTKAGESGIFPIFIHGTYLINLGTQNKEHLQKSIDWLIYALKVAGELGVEGVIFHLGSHKGVGFDQVLSQVVDSLSTILSEVEGSPYLILENSAGQGATLGDNFPELGQILSHVADDRLKICLDTCHAFAEGYDLKTKTGLEKALEEFDKEIGLSNLVAIHANDSKFDLGSNRDRHANIGEGFLGKEGMENIINHPALQNIPFILEVPGFDNKGPDKPNIDILKSLIHH